MASDIESDPVPPRFEQHLQDAGCMLAMRAGGLGTMLHPSVRRAVADAVRLADSYYTSVIGGSRLSPVDIELGVRGEFSEDGGIRHGQIEAAAYVGVQSLIDGGELDDFGLGTNFVRMLHEQMCASIPDEVCMGGTHAPSRGEWRRSDDGANPPSVLIPGVMRDFDIISDPDGVGLSRAGIAAALAHHGLLWISPFEEGNARIAQLHSRAYLRRKGFATDLWSLARGFAVDVLRYRRMLREADRGRIGEFAEYFIGTCVGQVNFMSTVLEPTAMLRRMSAYVESEAADGRFDRRVFKLLRHAFLVGQLPKNEISEILGVTDRHARRLIEPALADGVLQSGTRAEPYRIAFPLALMDHLLPRLLDT